MSSLNCREMCDCSLPSFSWNSIIMEKEEILCKGLWADWCWYQEGKMLARHHVLSQPRKGPSNGLCHLLYDHSLLKELGKKYHGPGRKENSGSGWRDAKFKPSLRRPWLAHLDVVKALVSTGVCWPMRWCIEIHSLLLRGDVESSMDQETWAASECKPLRRRLHMVFIG